MSYYDTIDEDLTRAREILAKGKPAHEEVAVAYLSEPMRAAALGGGAIYGGDTYAAYKLLESFVAEIDRLRAGMAYYKGLAAGFEQQVERLKELEFRMKGLEH